jgi:hypothetical protein
MEVGTDGIWKMKRELVITPGKGKITSPTKVLKGNENSSFCTDSSMANISIETGKETR